MLCKDGYAIVKRKPDKDNNPLSTSYFGIDQEPILYKGYHESRKVFNEKKFCVKESWLGLDGQPITNGDTYVKVVKDFDDVGNTILCEYYDAEDHLILCENGYARYKAKYNENKQQIWCEYFGKDDQPMVYKGYTIRTREYDGNGNVTVEKYFDADGNSVLCMAFLVFIAERGT